MKRMKVWMLMLAVLLCLAGCGRSTLASGTFDTLSAFRNLPLGGTSAPATRLEVHITPLPRTVVLGERAYEGEATLGGQTFLLTKEEGKVRFHAPWNPALLEQDPGQFTAAPTLWNKSYYSDDDIGFFYGRLSLEYVERSAAPEAWQHVEGTCRLLLNGQLRTVVWASNGLDFYTDGFLYDQLTLLGGFDQGLATLSTPQGDALCHLVKQPHAHLYSLVVADDRLNVVYVHRFSEDEIYHQPFFARNEAGELFIVTQGAVESPSSNVYKIEITTKGGLQ